MLYLINSNEKSVTHIWVTGAPRKQTRHIDMGDAATNVLGSSYKPKILAGLKVPAN